MTKIEKLYQKLPDIETIKGHEFSIKFSFWRDKVTPISLEFVRAEFRLCPYGIYDYPVLIKPCDVIDTDFRVCEVYLNTLDTKDLESIRHTYQVILMHDEGVGFIKESIGAEGDIIFKSRVEDSL